MFFGAGKEFLPIRIINKMVQRIKNANYDVELLMQFKAGNGALMKGNGWELVLCYLQHLGGLVDAVKFKFVGKTGHDATGAATKLEQGCGGGVVARDGTGNDANNVAAIAHDGVVERGKLVVVRHRPIIVSLEC